MRETIEKLNEYININCKPGRDDFEISMLYTTISALYSAIHVIRSIEEKDVDEYCDM